MEKLKTLPPISSQPSAHHAYQPTRPTRAEVSLDAIAHNLQCVRDVAHGAEVYAVVKADAYGHGLIPVGQRLQTAGVNGICVALAEEGFALRRAGIQVPILVLNGVYGRDHRHLLNARLTPVIFDLDQARAFAAAAGEEPMLVHLKVDTGMARLGVPLIELPALLDGLERMPQLRIDGLMTHLSSADSDREVTERQLALFDEACRTVRARGHQPRLLHVANTAGTYAFEHARLNMVRAGIALYGYSPVAGSGRDLRPAMRIRTEIAAVRDLPAGVAVGYSGTFVTRAPARIATVPLGYGDGLMRAASNRGQMLVRGTRCPIVGNVSMDLTSLDVTHLAACEVGDEVVLIGEQGSERLTAEDLAAASGTISYEVLTNISPRVPRFYV